MYKNNANKIKVLIDRVVENEFNTLLTDNALINKEKIELN